MYSSYLIPPCGAFARRRLVFKDPIESEMLLKIGCAWPKHIETIIDFFGMQTLSFFSIIEVNFNFFLVVGPWELRKPASRQNPR